MMRDAAGDDVEAALNVVPDALMQQAVKAGVNLQVRQGRTAVGVPLQSQTQINQ